MSSKNSPRTLQNGLPRANAHSWRPPTGSPSDPDVVLASLPMGTPDYLRVIGAYFTKYNSQHSKKNKGVSFKTMHDRQRMVVSFFRELRHETPYRNLDPRQLANRHIEAMVTRWLERRLSTATIHNYLSFLRTFAGWIGKAGMVREPEFYVGADSPHAHRSEVATEDRSWSAMNVDISAKIAEIARFDSWVGLQLELEAGFGLRGKEARHLKPHGAIVTRDAANPRDAAAFPECRTFLHISAGSKGGRPRDVPIQTQAQQDLLDQVMKLVPPGSYVGRPGFTSLQNQAHFYYVIRKFGISKADLGVVSPLVTGRTSPPGAHLRRGAICQNDRLHRVIDAEVTPDEGRTRTGSRSVTSATSASLGCTGYLGSDAGLPEAANDPAAWHVAGESTRNAHPDDWRSDATSRHFVAAARDQGSRSVTSATSAGQPRMQGIPVSLMMLCSAGST
jgi:site-specific recombinase XerC